MKALLLATIALAIWVTPAHGAAPGHTYQDRSRG